MKADKLILPIVLWLLCAVSSCNRNEPILEEDEPSYRELHPSTIDSLFFEAPCYFSENLPDEIKDIFLLMLPKKSVATKPPVAIITSSEIRSELARQTLKSNGTVFIYLPRNVDLDGTLDSISHPLIGQNLSGVAFLGLKMDGSSFQLLDGGRDLKYTDILQLVNWTNGTFGAESTYSEILDFSHITPGPFPFELKDKQICHVMWSKPDYMSGTGEVSLIFNISPIHKIGDSTGDAADYYIVKSEVTVHSDKMYDKRTKKHGGVKVRLCGFYLERFKFSMELLDQNGNNKGSFCLVPVPATFVGSTSYTNSVDWNLGGQISTSVANASVSTGVIFSNSVTNVINDIDLLNQHNNGVAVYQVNIGNLPHYKSDISISNPPEVAKGDLTINSNWIWRVPQGDNTTDEYMVRFTVADMVYGACYFYSSEADFHTLNFDIPKIDHVFSIPVPSREATGTVSIKKGPNYPDSITLIHENGRKYVRNTDDRDVYDFVVLEGDYTVSYSYKGTTYTYDKKITVPRCGLVTLDMGYGFN